MHADDDVKWIFGYLDPNYVISGSITEKNYIYCFGVLLLVFLTGKKPDNAGWGKKFCSIIENGKAHIYNDRFSKFFYSKILGEGVSKDQAQQLKDFLALACTIGKHQARPNIIDVAKEPMQIEKPISP